MRSNLLAFYVYAGSDGVAKSFIPTALGFLILLGWLTLMIPPLASHICQTLSKELASRSRFLLSVVCGTVDTGFIYIYAKEDDGF